MSRKALTVAAATLTLLLALVVCSRAAALPSAEAYELQTVAYPSWGNHTYADCPYATAAAWVDAYDGAVATEAEVVAAFEAEGGEGANPGSAGTLAAIDTYWGTHPIGGYYGHLTVEGGTLLTNTMPAAATINLSALPAGSQIAALANGAQAGHVILVMGYRAEGVRIETWGQTVWLTWTEWDALQVTLYRVDTSPTQAGIHQLLAEREQAQVVRRQHGHQ